MSLMAGLYDTLPQDTECVVALVRAAFGPATRSIIHYGSRVHGAGVQESSEYDFVVVVDGYEQAIQSVVAASSQRFSTYAGRQLSRVLPPSMIAISVPQPVRAGRAKCGLYSSAHFTRACSATARDHFLRGRLFQDVRIAWCRDENCRQEAEAAIVVCRQETFNWVQTRLPTRFSPACFLQTLLQVSYGAEIRPEQKTRTLEVFQAQSRVLTPLYEQLLAELARNGRLRQIGGQFELLAPAAVDVRRRADRYFRISKTRATLRWAKSAWLYRGWMGYVKHKMQRRILKSTGTKAKS